jgi:group I intron endonuclease
MYPQQPGTYCFWNKVYVGSTKCLYTRINQHIKGCKSNKLLQRAIIKYGLKAFSITYLITEAHTEAKRQEQLILDYIFKNNTPKYNLSANAYGGDGSNAIVRYALEVNNANLIYIFKSSIEAESFTGVASGNIFRSCKKTSLENGKGRWLFSDVSKADLEKKFKTLGQKKITGNKETNTSRDKTRGFILIDKKTKTFSPVFYKLKEPLVYGYKIHIGNLSKCLLGKRKTINGYYVSLL